MAKEWASAIGLDMFNNVSGQVVEVNELILKLSQQLNGPTDSLENLKVCSTVCSQLLFALNCSPSTTVCPKLFALD